jgi:hypothetical protein
MKKLFYERRFIFIPIGVAAILALVSFVVMQLWNNLLPDIIHVGTITYWQAMGIFVLCKILFGFGPKGGRGGGAPWMRRKQMMQERLAGMTAEERDHFKQQMKNRCGWGGRGRNDWREAWKESPIAEKESKTE